LYQSITLVGNLGNDPEMRYTPSGVAVASFRLAVNRSWTGQDGQRQEKVTWFHVSVWNKQAEAVTQYLSKGRQVLVVGEIEEARAYVNKAGELAASIEVKASSVRFLGQKGDDIGGSVAPPSTHNSSPTPSNEIDIPF